MPLSGERVAAKTHLVPRTALTRPRSSASPLCMSLRLCCCRRSRRRRLWSASPRRPFALPSAHRRGAARVGVPRRGAEGEGGAGAAGREVGGREIAGPGAGRSVGLGITRLRRRHHGEQQQQQQQQCGQSGAQRKCRRRCEGQ
jgi:hypothetical protein